MWNVFFIVFVVLRFMFYNIFELFLWMVVLFLFLNGGLEIMRVLEVGLRGEKVNIGRVMKI